MAKNIHVTDSTVFISPITAQVGNALFSFRGGYKTFNEIVNFNTAGYRYSALMLENFNNFPDLTSVLGPIAATPEDLSFPYIDPAVTNYSLSPIGLFLFEYDNNNITLINFEETSQGGGAGLQGATGIFGVTGLQGPGGGYGQTGIQGETGINGISGAPGETGIMGVTGLALGETGIQGPQGDQGIPGPQGDPGPQGFLGETGIQGPYGYTGISGITGIYGVTGIYGQTGVQGIQGVTGLSDVYIVEQNSFTATLPTSKNLTVYYDLYSNDLVRLHFNDLPGLDTGALKSASGTPVPLSIRPSQNRFMPVFIRYDTTFFNYQMGVLNTGGFYFNSTYYDPLSDATKATDLFGGTFLYTKSLT